MIRLDLARVYLANDSPGSTIREAERKHGDDHHPSGNAGGMHRARRVQGSDQEHAAGQDHTACDGRSASSPFIREQKAGYGDG